jgi:hypothetical protein
MQNVTRHPIDYDLLNKGDVIPVNRVEEIVGVKRAAKEYAFRLLRLKGRIEHELAERGKVWTLSTDHGDLRILTDSEASTYNEVESAHARRKERRCFARQAAVDVSKLSEDERPAHERRVYVQGKYIQAAASVRQSLRLKPVERTVPGLPASGQS